MNPRCKQRCTSVEGVAPGSNPEMHGWPLLSASSLLRATRGSSPSPLEYCAGSIGPGAKTTLTDSSSKSSDRSVLSHGSTRCYLPTRSLSTTSFAGDSVLARSLSKGVRIFQEMSACGAHDYYLETYSVVRRNVFVIRDHKPHVNARHPLRGPH